MGGSLFTSKVNFSILRWQRVSGRSKRLKMYVQDLFGSLLFTHIHTTLTFLRLNFEEMFKT